MNKIILLLIFLMVPFALVLCQKKAFNVSIDSLFKETTQYFIEGDYNAILDVDSILLLRAQQEKDTLAIGRSYHYSGLAYTNKQKPEIDEAINCLKNAIQCYIHENDKARVILAYDDIAKACEKRGDYNNSLKFSHLAINYLGDDTVSYANRLLMIKVYNNAANRQSNIGAKDTSILLHHKALSIAESLSSLEGYDENSANVLLADIQYNLGNRYADLGEDTLSYIYYQKALSFYERDKESEDYALILQGLGLNHLELERFDSASIMLTHAAKIFESLEDSTNLSLTYYNLALLSQKKEDYNEALEFSKLSINFLNADYGYLRDLLLTNVSLSMMHKRYQNTILITGGTIFALLVLVVLLWVKWKSDQFKIKEKELIHQQEILRMKESFSAIKHDKIKNAALRSQYLINSFLQTIQEEKVPANLLINAKHTLDRIVYFAEVPIDRIDEVHNYKKPKKLMHFVKEMHQIAEAQSNLLKIPKPNFEDYEEVADFMVKPEVQSKIIDEIIGNAFDNIRLHSNCTAATLVIKGTSRKIVLEIEDNGKGYDMNTIREGAQGVQNITKAAESFGGNVTINTAPGQGTKMKIVIPNPYEDQ